MTPAGFVGDPAALAFPKRGEAPAPTTRFILLSQPRNGTHFVSGLLNTHPQVLCLDEPLNPGVNRADVPAAVISEMIWAEPDMAANGFIVHWNQHAEPGLGEGFLFGLPENVRVVWVCRVDVLATIVSRRIAEVTGRWQSGEPTTMTLAIDAPSLRDDYEELMFERCLISAWMRRRRSAMTMSYESVVRQPDMPRVQSFLGIPFEPLNATDCGAFKQELRPLSQVLENYAELERELAGTPLANLFRPEHRREESRSFF